MMILGCSSVRKYYGHTLIRPSDRSCWILKSPKGTSAQYYTRKAAIEAAKSKSTKLS